MRLAIVIAFSSAALLAGCRTSPQPRPRPCTSATGRCAPAVKKPRCEPGRRAKSRLALPADGCRRYLQDTAPLPLPPDAATVHLELARLRRDADGRKVIAGVWDGLRADSMAAGQLLPYLKRCAIRPRRDLTAITLSQPLQSKPDADRLVIFWGLLTAQRTVACLRRTMEADGARTSFLPAGGEPGFSADRPVSDLHLDAVALDASTLVVASGKHYRAFLRRRIHGKGRTLAQTSRYVRAVRTATSKTLLLAFAPRLPKRLPHVSLPADAHRHLRGMSFALTRARVGLHLTGDLDVGQKRRAQGWADKAPGKLRLLAMLSPSAHAPLLRRTRIQPKHTRLQLHLALESKDLDALGSLLSRWLPW